jgi:hypothetical protein
VEIRHITKIIRAKYRDYAAKVIADIKTLGPECRQNDDDSPLDDVWEEFKSELQYEQSLLFEAYELTIYSMCCQVVESLPQHEQEILWFGSDTYFDWNNESDPPYMLQDVAKQLYKAVCDVATNERFKNQDAVERIMYRD